MEFLLGAATAAHQVEGNNRNSDYWVMENVPHSSFREPSLDALDHYHRYKEDISLLKEAGGNAYRFSIEWARIQPEKNEFDQNEIQHYREVIEFCLENDITPIVTLHHFTSPKWVITDGGWKSKNIIKFFSNYAEVIAKELGELIPFVCTINEANMGSQIYKVMRTMMDAGQGGSEQEKESMQVGIDLDEIKKTRAEYFKELAEIFGVAPNNINSFLDGRNKKEEVVMQAHQMACELFRKHSPSTKLGLSLSLYDYQAVDGGEKNVEKEQQEDFFDYLAYLKNDDFIGIQNYSRKVFNKNGLVKDDEDVRMTKMGYNFYPEGIGNVLKFVSKHWDKPLLVTENGISTDDDTERVEFIEKALKGVQECLDDGISVVGYTYWSLMDNFEWQLGYEQTFGLIAVDRETQKRYPKPSLAFLGSRKISPK